MAGNKKIFDLPLRTGVTADDRLAIVDSGNTTTYSVKLSDLQDGTGVNTLESLTGNITFSGTNIDISTDGQTIVLSGSTGGGGGSGNLVAATGTTSYKTANIPDADIQGDYSIYIGNNQYANDGITSTAGYNNVFGNGEITAGSQGLVVSSNYSGRAKIADGAFYGNAVIQSGSINNAGFRGGVMLHNHDGDYNNGQFSVMAGGYFNDLSGDANFLATSNAYANISGNYNVMISSQAGDLTGTGNVGLSQGAANVTGNYSAKICGDGGNITGDYSGTFVGQGNVVNHDRSVILGGVFLSSNYDDEVQVPNLTIAYYSVLNFADDTAAAAGGVSLGQVYHNNGDLRIRIT
jgi:hypothetical protein